MKEHEHDFYTNLRNVSFKVNTSENLDSVINEALIGRLKTPIIDLIKLRNIEPKTINLKRVSELRISSMCELDDIRLCAVDISKDDLFVLNKKTFEIIEIINQIGVVTFKRPQALCLNEFTKEVYLSDTLNNRIVVLNNELNTVKRIFGEKGNTIGKFNRPKDIQFFSSLFYVLDSDNKRIQVFTHNFEFIREFYLYKRVDNQTVLLVYPIKMTINSDFIAINDANDALYIYDHYDKLIYSIDQPFLQTFLFIGSYLFVHTLDGSIVCYDFDDSHIIANVENNTILPSFQRVLDGLKHYSFSMKYIDGQLMIALVNKKCLVCFSIDKYSI